MAKKVKEEAPVEETPTPSADPIMLGVAITFTITAKDQGEADRMIASKVKKIAKSWGVTPNSVESKIAATGR